MNAIQLDFFEPTDELSLLKKEIDMLKDSLRRTQKRLFKQQNDYGKDILKIHQEIDILRSEIHTKKSKNKSEKLEHIEIAMLKSN